MLYGYCRAVAAWSLLVCGMDAEGNSDRVRNDPGRPRAA